MILASFLCACGGGNAAAGDPSVAPPPLVPEAQTANGTGTRPVPATRSTESKTIGGDPYATKASSDGRQATPQSTSTPGRSGAWSPTPVNGSMNPSPPGPATPVNGDMNPSPPGR